MRNQPPFSGAFMFPMLMPGGMPDMEPHQHHSHMMPDVPVPARVKVAMEFLSMLHQKEMRRGAIAEGASQPLELDGIKPTVHEEGSSEAACELLSAYFRGSLPMDKWEELRFQVVQKRVDKEELDAKCAREQKQQGPVGPCPVCRGTRGIPCKLCRGAGRIMMVPVLQNAELVDPACVSSQEASSGPLGGLIAAMDAMFGGGDESDDSEKTSDPKDTPEETPES